MNYNEIKKNLEEITNIDKFIKSCMDELEILSSRTMRISKYSGISRGGECGQLEELYEKIAIKSIKLTNIVLRKECLIDWFNKATVKLEIIDRAILTDRFINNKKLEVIAKEYYYTCKQHVLRRINSIISHLV